MGVAEMFDYNSDVNMITIGYRLHEQFWGKGVVDLIMYSFLKSDMTK
jgi:ribosomal-protein-alanine N-acetyltransferase